MKSSCNRCGFFETVWNFEIILKNEFFENDERLLKSKGGWKRIEYFYKWVSSCGFRCFSRWNLLTSVGGFILNFTIFRWFDTLVFAHFIIFGITIFLVMEFKRESTSFLMVARSHAELWDVMAERIACFRLNPFENLAWEFWEFGLVSFALGIIFNKLVPCYIKFLRYEFQSLTCMSGLVTNEGNKPNLLSHKLFYKSPKLIYC